MEWEQILQLLLVLLFLFGGVIGQAVTRKRRQADQDQSGSARPVGGPSREPSRPEGEIARRVREMLEAAREAQVEPRPIPAAVRPEKPRKPVPRPKVEQPPPAHLGAAFEKEFAKFQEGPNVSWAERPDSLLNTPRESIHARVHPRAAALRAMLRQDPRLAILGYEVLGTPLGLRPFSEGGGVRN